MTNGPDNPRYFMHLHNMARARRITLSGIACSADGPRHQPSWTATIQVNDCYFTGVGRTKSEAKDEAAKQALQALGFLEL